MFDPKIVITPGFVGVVTGSLVGLATIVGTVVKLTTRNNVTKPLCDERHKSLDGKIDDLKDTVNNRFDDIKTIIQSKTQ